MGEEEYFYFQNDASSPFQANCMQMLDYTYMIDLFGISLSANTSWLHLHGAVYITVK